MAQKGAHIDIDGHGSHRIDRHPCAIDDFDSILGLTIELARIDEEIHASRELKNAVKERRHFVTSFF